MKIKLGELADIMTGNTPSMKVNEYYDSNDIPFIKPDSFKGHFELEANSFLSNKAERKARIVGANCILVSCIGIIGKVGITSQKVAFNQQINSLNVKSHYDIEYIAYNLLFNKDRLQRICNSAVVPLINKTQFSNFEISINKDIIIQRDIKNKLNLLSSIINNNKKKLLLLDDIVKSRFVELFGDVVLNTLNWPLVKLSDIAEYRIGLTYKPDAISSSGTAVLRSGNIQNSQLCYEDIIYVNSKVEPKLLLKNHDILMCARNGSQSLVGKVALIENDISNTTYGAFMMAISSKYYVYLFEYFRSQAFRRLISVGSTTTINQVTTRMLNSIVIPLPDLESINRFALYHSQINKLKSDVQKSIEETQLLMDSLMQEYFG
ncbi:MAG: restriction endonuclease subunit S [Streptococcus parasanguinis]|nr:restriction endonuclease subunit S [Streptococcus parasanguinis]